MKTILETVSSHIREIGGANTTFSLPMSLWDFQNYKVITYSKLMQGLVLKGPYNGDKIVFHHWKRRAL